MLQPSVHQWPQGPLMKHSLLFHILLYQKWQPFAEAGVEEVTEEVEETEEVTEEDEAAKHQELANLQDLQSPSLPNIQIFHLVSGQGALCTDAGAEELIFAQNLLHAHGKIFLHQDPTTNEPVTSSGVIQ